MSSWTVRVAAAMVAVVMAVGTLLAAGSLPEAAAG